jgi:hypothetical protein
MKKSLILYGWILMMAPTTITLDSGGHVKAPGPITDANRPLREWETIRAFDTAKECEAQREKVVYDLIKKFKSPEFEADDLFLRGMRGLVLCVPSERAPY